MNVLQAAGSHGNCTLQVVIGAQSDVLMLHFIVKCVEHMSINQEILRENFFPLQDLLMRLFQINNTRWLKEKKM